jgi:hypothetical protein
MAKKLDLRTWLVESRLFFLQKGYYEIADIYEIVQEKVPHLCDDEVLCTHVNSANDYPEWKHSVRWALNELKGMNVVKSVDDSQGIWKKITKHN